MRLSWATAVQPDGPTGCDAGAKADFRHSSLGACYKQLNSSVGQFGNFTLRASTAAVESSTPGDAEYQTVNAALAGLDRVRDSLALRVKGELEAAAFGDQPIAGAAGQTVACQGIIAAAGVLAKHL
jgi:hypothetical protein